MVCFAFSVFRMSYDFKWSVPWVGLQCVIFAFSDHIHLLFMVNLLYTKSSLPVYS